MFQKFEFQSHPHCTERTRLGVRIQHCLAPARPHDNGLRSAENPQITRQISLKSICRGK